MPPAGQEEAARSACCGALSDAELLGLNCHDCFHRLQDIKVVKSSLAPCPPARRPPALLRCGADCTAAEAGRSAALFLP